MDEESKRPPAAVRESAPPYPAAQQLDDQRFQQLTADLKLTPAERVHAAHATAQVGRRPSRVSRILQFDRYEDYLEWQKGEGLLV
jgi:hypothetical protein